MKDWLAANGLQTDTLGKKQVAELLKTAPRAAKNGAHIAAATGEKLREKVSGDGKRSVRGRARARVLPVLRRANRPLGGAQYPAAKTCRRTSCPSWTRRARWHGAEITMR